MLLIAKQHSFISVLADDSEPGEIQFMPPGTHTITPHTADGSPTTITICVDAATAATLESARAALTAQGDPYLDFDHADGPAAAWVKEFYWAGDDPTSGGVRARVEWSARGREAVRGREYRKFSPTFQISQPDAQGICRVVGTSLNMGGLVNRPAFTSIAPLAAKDDSTTINTNHTHKMPDMQDNTTAELELLKKELDSLREENQSLRDQLESLREKAADDALEAACAQGKISPEMKASWKDLILSNPEALTLLAKQPVNPAFSTTYSPQHYADKASAASPQAILAKHAAITDPEERLDFFRANKAALIAARG